jgi:hypothetical protein
VFGVSISAACPPVTADAPLASDNDKPAAPNNGTAHARRFCFEDCFACDMVIPPIPGKYLTNRSYE